MDLRQEAYEGYLPGERLVSRTYDACCIMSLKDICMPYAIVELVTAGH